MKIANNSELFINQNNLCQIKFAWQQSACAYSVSKDDVDKVCKYILNQKEHHKKMSYQEECNVFLKIYLEKIQHE